MSLVNKNQWEDRHYDFSFQKIAAKLHFAPTQSFTLAQTLNRLASAAVTCIGGHLLYFGITYQSQPGVNPAKLYLARATRPTFHSFMTFGTKVAVDSANANGDWGWNEHKKGALVGLLSYLVMRPFDQIATARQEILANEGKRMGLL